MDSWGTPVVRDLHQDIDPLTTQHHVQLAHQNLQGFLWKAASHLITHPPWLYFCMGLFCTRCNTLLFRFVNFMKFLNGHFPSLSRSLWMVASGLSATPPSFALSANSLKVYFIPSARSLMMLLNNSGLSYQTLQNTINDWPPDRVCATQRNLVLPVHWPVCSLYYHL